MPYREQHLRPPRAPWTWADALQLAVCCVVFVACAAALVWVLT